MTTSTITIDGVRIACAEPFADLDDARGIADLLACGGWSVHSYHPPVPVEDRPGERLVASVYSADGELCDTVQPRRTGRTTVAKIDKLVGQAKAYLNPGEVVEAAVQGTYETKIMGQDTVGTGVMLATNQRVVFYAKKMGGYELESFPYPNIGSFEAGKNLMGHHVRFASSGNDVSLKWINGGDIDRFAQLVRQRAGVRPAPAPAAAQPAPPPASVADELHKLAGLVQQGLMSREEFEAQKARLLA